ncbi:MAG: hypothetical protein R2844_16055 [Caldilineales bacterium]
MEPDARAGLAALWAELSQLEAPITELFVLAVATTRKPTPAQQRQLAQGHRRIVRKRAEIESASLSLLKLPLLPARAIHQVACAIEIAAELERIAYLLRHMVRSPLLTHGSTSQQAGAALATALTASQECVALVLSGLAAHDTNNHPPLLTAHGRAEAQFALVYNWMADDSTRAAARPICAGN